jgi:hypothetical protein
MEVRFFHPDAKGKWLGNPRLIRLIAFQRIVRR